MKNPPLLPLAARGPATPTALPARARVRVEVPRGSFAKRSPGGRVEFLSPLPCPFHYGSVVGVLGADGDPQDAIVLGGACRRGTEVDLPVQASVRFVDEGVCDDKWVCAAAPLSRRQELALIAFFRLYGAVKVLRDRARGELGATGYRGFVRASERQD